MTRLSHGLRACLLLALASCAVSSRPVRDPLDGLWQGTAVFRGASLGLSVRFHQRGDTLRGAVSVPDFLLLEQTLDSVRFRSSRVSFSTRDDQPLHFEGVLRGDSISGEAAVPDVPGVVETHGQRSALRFVLRRASAAAALPYRTHEVHFESKGARLAGTLLVPLQGPPSHPGIVILQGSSANLRRDYLFYADHFARAGFAVLTFDKRGHGESSGNYGSATYDDLTADAAAAVELLRARPEVTSEAVGVWGLSQGALIAPRLAARVPSLRFIVAVSPPGVQLGIAAAYQDSVRLVARGFTASEGSRAANLHRQILTWLTDGRGEAALIEELDRTANERWRRASSLTARLPATPQRESWYWRGRTLDPIPSWRALKTPALVVLGGSDELLPAEVSATNIQRALRDGAHVDATVRVFPGANHMLRVLPPSTEGPWDWPRAAPGYLELITSWSLARVHER